MRIPFGTITITDKSKKLILDCLEKGRISGGKYVREFEERFADIVGAKEAVAVSSGTDADTLALAVLHDIGAKRGDEVITPALSFVATGNAVLHAGFTPVFVDIDPETFNIDPKLIEDLKNKLVDVIFVYSKRAADQLLKIILNHKIENDLDNCSLNCISINVANTLKRLKWKKIKIFLPSEEELSLL
jgi:hypothetical protein